MTRRGRCTHKTVTGMENLWFSTWGATVDTYREDKQKHWRTGFKALFVFFCTTVATFHSSYLLHPEGFHSRELRRAALQEDSTRPQRTSLALLLNNPVRLWAAAQAIISLLQLPIATFPWWRNAIAPSQNLSAPFLVSVAHVNFWALKDLDVLRKGFGTTGMFTGVHGWRRGVTSLTVLQRKTFFCLFFRSRGLLNRITPHILLKRWGCNIFQSSNHSPLKPEPMQSFTLGKWAWMSLFHRLWKLEQHLFWVEEWSLYKMTQVK